MDLEMDDLSGLRFLVRNSIGVIYAPGWILSRLHTVYDSTVRAGIFLDRIPALSNTLPPLGG